MNCLDLGKQFQIRKAIAITLKKKDKEFSANNSGSSCTKLRIHTRQKSRQENRSPQANMQVVICFVYQQKAK